MTRGRLSELNLYTRATPFVVKFDEALERGRKAYYRGGELLRICPLGEMTFDPWDEIRFSPHDVWVWPEGEGEFPSCRTNCSTR